MVEYLPLPEGCNIAIGSSRDETAGVLKAQFGTRFMQRAPDGSDNISQTYNVSFEVLTHAESQALLTFFRRCGGAKAFYYTPPDETMSRQWTCEKWSVKHLTSVYDTVTCTFEEVRAP